MCERGMLHKLCALKKPLSFLEQVYIIYCAGGQSSEYYCAGGQSSEINS